MAFITRRLLSSTARLYTAVATPAPVHVEAVLGTAELQSISKKAEGPWSALTKEEQVTLYRASFPETFQEANSSKGTGIPVLVGVSVSIVIAYFLSNFLRNTIGPTLPPTYQNAQWEADTREKLRRQKANPIEGISSRPA